MNPTSSSPLSPPPSNPRYELITEAAHTIKTELSFFSADEVEDFSDSDTDTTDSDENATTKISPDELELEILFLRSSLEYFYSHKVFPFSNPTATTDFITTHLPMNHTEFTIRNQRMKNRYKKRVWKICKKFRFLENPREQDAFELGNRIWGGMSVEMIRLNKEDGQEDIDETMVSAEQEKKEKEKEKEEGDDNEVVLQKYPLLKKAFRFKGGVIKMPVVSKGVVEKGLVALGEERVKQWEERWKRLQVEELKTFLAKVSIIRHYTITLLDELQASKKNNTNLGADHGR